MLKQAARKEGYRFAFVFLSLALVAATIAGSAVSLPAQDESVQRDRWQRPDEVMDALGIKAGSAVADVGAGNGYFTFHFATRVGPTGKVYAEDVRENEMADIHSGAQKKGLNQIETIVGTPDDPKLPAGTLDAVLVCNAYHEMHDYDAMLQGMYKALKPGGIIGIIDAAAQPGQPRGSYYQPHHIPKELVRDDLARNGFHFLREGRGFVPPDEGTRTYYFLIFEKPATPAGK
ncbi:MAG TPA: class I SAM-dependent methyltransferase [Candidatus Acidoferrales bacterium]|nr:class I SAM-dependent methyltransferase [Candidatus Acidoferrales bacterium]